MLENPTGVEAVISEQSKLKSSMAEFHPKKCLEKAIKEYGPSESELRDHIDPENMLSQKQVKEMQEMLAKVEIGGRFDRPYTFFIERADQPEAYNWDHLHLNWWARLWRFLLVFGICLAVLALACVAIFMMKTLEGNLAVERCSSVYGNATKYPVVCAGLGTDPAAEAWYYEAFTRARAVNNNLLIHRDATDVEECGCKYADQTQHEFGCCETVNYEDESAALPVTKACAGRPPAVRTWHDAKNASCQRPDVLGLLNEGGDIDAICYACMCALNPSNATTGEQYCEDWASVEFTSRLLTVVAQVTVVAVRQRSCF
eukprot:SAG22_NODE_1780_length_3600_cov_1.391888_1_plen_315_part_00